VTFRDVVDAHDIALTYGGLHGVINGAGLESAIGRPYNGYYPRVWSKAAALVESLVRNHPFADGNKRTALIVTYLFLLRSEYRFRRPMTIVGPFERMILGVAARKLSFGDVEDWFRVRIVPRWELRAGKRKSRARRSRA
jgi:death-on-curing protein